MPKSFLIISILIIPHLAKSQEKGSFEQYYYTGSGASVIVPKIYFQNNSNWFGEVRYNYEELETISLNAGKMFSYKNDLSYSFKPYAGLMLGRMNGGTVGSNINLDYRDLFFSSESQYSFSVNEKARNFFFNWSELGYQFSNLMYSGFALQMTRPFEIKYNWEPGVMLGITYKNWTFPFYTFSPVSFRRNYVLGVNWEWNYKNSKTLNRDLLTIH